MHQKELNIVRFSMLVLFSALMIIYLLLYQIKGDAIVEQLSSVKEINIDKNSIGEKLESQTGDILDTTDQLSDTDSLLFEDTQDIDKLGTGKEINSNSDSLFEDSSGANKIIMLSGTNLRYGKVESTEKLGIGYQYALKDQKDIYYVFLDPKKYNFDEIVKKLGGSTYTITTEKEIIENKLFGEKITFINLQEYKEKKVIILIEIDKSLWLLQVNYPTYHSSKEYLKNLFIK